jgi:hypothetical protein
MRDLYVVFNGQSCIGLATTLEHATTVARSVGEVLEADSDPSWVPAFPHGWVIPGTQLRTILKAVTEGTPDLCRPV